MATDNKNDKNTTVDTDGTQKTAQVTEQRPADPIPASQIGRPENRPNATDTYDIDVDNLADTDERKEALRMAKDAEPDTRNVVVEAHKATGVIPDPAVASAANEIDKQVEDKGFTVAPAGAIDAPVVDPSTAELEADMTPRKVQKVTPAPVTR